MDNKVICLDNEYDTYIEELFFKKVKTDIKSKITRNNIIAAWRLDKKIYTDYSGSISHEFLHYSLHDQSHSISILQYVYLLLGEELLNNFSVSDLWIMLEVAYSHDIGMAATYEELKRIWDDKIEINNIIKKILKYSDKEAMELYNCVNERIEHDLNNPNDELLHTYPHWQLEFRKAINFINAEYLRKKHSSKSKTIIDKVLLELNTKHLNIEERFYKIIGQINYLHGEDFCQIEKILENEELGLETDVFHPRMIAMLLRMGDVLDIRNNRFNLRDKEYLGGLPKDSKEHFLKHKGVTNFLVTNEYVRVHIKSNDLNVCKNSAYWLEYIENEYNNFTSHWNNYVSDNLKGLKLKNIDLGIEYKGKKFISQDFSQYLKTDPQKLMQLMVGKNLYNTNLIMFREYLQNAIDASKVKLAMTYIDDEKFLEKCNVDNFKKVIPENFLEDFEDLSIIVSYEYDEFTDSISFSIIDQGIGMDEDGLNALCNIGQGWNHRREISNRFNEFPEWLRPTGGFGIGTLSAFLLSNQVKFKTKSKNHPYYIVTINSPINGNDGAIEKIIADNDDKLSGTEVSIKMDFNKYYYEITRYFLNEGIETVDIQPFANVCNRGVRELFIQKTLQKFVDDLIVNPFFYVKFIDTSKMYMNERYVESSKEIDYYNYWDKENEILIKYNNRSNDYFEDDLILNQTSEDRVDKCIFAYKGMKVNKSNQQTIIDTNNRDLYLLTEKIIKSIDFYSDKVTDVLDISRSGFSSNFNLEKNVNDILYESVVRYIKDDSFNNKIFNKAIEKMCIYFYDKLKKNSSLLECINKKSIMPKKFYFFDRKELYHYRLVDYVNKVINQLNNMENYNIHMEKKSFKGDGSTETPFKILENRIDDLLDALKLFDDEKIKNKTLSIKKQIESNTIDREELSMYEQFLTSYSFKYKKNLKKYEYSLIQLLENDKIYVDFLETYTMDIILNEVNIQKTLYYNGDNSKSLYEYKYLIERYLKGCEIENNGFTESKFIIKKVNTKSSIDNSINICNLIAKNLDKNRELFYRIDYKNEEYVVNFDKYEDLLVKNFDENKVLINPFVDVVNIFVGDNTTIKILNSGEFKEQKIINYLNKSNEFKKFINNIYKYKLASTTNEKEKQKINREKIRKLYVSLICEVLEKYAMKKQ